MMLMWFWIEIVYSGLFIILLMSIYSVSDIHRNSYNGRSVFVTKQNSLESQVYLLYFALNKYRDRS